MLQLSAAISGADVEAASPGTALAQALSAVQAARRAVNGNSWAQGQSGSSGQVLQHKQSSQSRGAEGFTTTPCSSNTEPMCVTSICSPLMHTIGRGWNYIKSTAASHHACSLGREAGCVVY